MFTTPEAEIFVKELLEDVFPNGKVDAMINFYTPEVIGHYGDETFGFNEIRERILAIKATTKKCYFVVNKVTVIDKLVVFVCRQNWINKNDSCFYDELVFGAYRIRDKKICEAWIIDSPKSSYRQTNEDFVKNKQFSELNQKLKQEFLDKLELVQKTYLDKAYKLSKVEKDCLYYYFNGFSAKESALAMSLSPRTIETYLGQIKEKFGCTTKYELRKKIFPDNIK